MQDQADSIPIRQPKIDGQNVELAHVSKPLSGFCVGRNFHFVSLFVKRAPRETLYIGFIIHKKKAHDAILVQ